MSDFVALRYYGTRLNLSDVEDIIDNQFLNDAVIEFYFAYLEKYVFEWNPGFLFISPVVTQGIKMSPPEDLDAFLDRSKCLNAQLMFFPLNNNACEQAGGTHWSLFVYDHVKRQCLHYDSSGYCNEIIAAQFYEKFVKYLDLSHKVNFISKLTLQQKNGIDCGIHVLAQTEHLAKHYQSRGKIADAPKLKDAAVNNRRRDLFYLIKHLSQTEQ